MPGLQDTASRPVACRNERAPARRHARIAALPAAQGSDSDPTATAAPIPGARLEIHAGAPQHGPPLSQAARMTGDAAAFARSARTGRECT